MKNLGTRQEVLFMNKTIKRIKFVCLIAAFIFISIDAQAIVLLENGKVIIPDESAESIKIDGILNENIWGLPPISEEFITFLPVFGEKLEQKTKIWMAYDNKNLYFAFKCYDSEPNKIKTSITKRDTTGRDDWMGVIIDTLGNRQTSYEFYINPDGIQEDGLTSAVNGWSYDNSPDFVWESAGKIVDDGYQVETCIPLESIRFKSGKGKEVKMGIIFMRNISRLGKMGAWPGIEAGQTQFNAMAEVIYKRFKKGLRLEVLPNVVYSRNVERENGGDWGDSDTSTNIGASIKYGITSAITSEATINPDFSQVESDAFQVLVNQRYPVFYSEKRPFFMEGMDVLDFGLISQGMMVSAVHTRRIIDPGWAAKLSGTSGKMAFNLLVSNDNAPGLAWEGEVNPHEGENAFWGIARAKYSLGSDNSLGILYSGRYFAGGKNNVLGADLQYRFLRNARLKISYLYSNTREPDQEEIQNGNGLNAMVEYSTRRIDAFAAYERYSQDFLMYSAFQNRTGIGRGILYVGPNFYIVTQKLNWIQKIQPHIQYSRLYDFGTRMYDTNWLAGLDMHFTRGGFLRVEFRREKEAWQGQLFNQDYLYAFGRVQLFKWLYMQGSYRYGDQVYYNPQEPCLSTGNTLTLGFILQPGMKLNLDFQFLHSALYRESDGQKLYSVDILNLSTSYQFNKYFFLRAAVRYDNYQEKLLTDFLASFTLIPGTVIHLGYGSLYEKKAWQNDRWVPGQENFLNMKNGLFFKVSYLWRIR
jgi:hypothetical protein